MQPFIKPSTLVVVIVALNLSVCCLASPPVLRGICGAVADAEEAVGAKALAAGKVAAELALKPIAIAGGLKAAAVGTGMKVSGAAIKLVGAKLAKDGLILETAGAGVKGAGLGVAALGVKPFAEKVVVAGLAAQKTVDGAHNAAEKLAKSVGDTSLQVDATLDSPFVGHHHKELNVTAGLNTLFMQRKHSNNEIQTEQQVTDQQLTQEQVEVPAEEKTDGQRQKRAAKVDPEVSRATFNLIREAKLEDCVARAICDLNCNPQGFGQDGKQVFLSMVRLQGASGFEGSETKYFHEAASKGRTYTGRCDQCSIHYDKCKSKSSDLIKMASHIRLD